MNDLAKIDDSGGLESLLAHGDIGRMEQPQRLAYYRALCDAAGLNPVTSPFEYLVLKGKTVLYAKKGATDALRAKHRISLQIVSRVTADGVHSVVCRATTPDGRSDESVGAVPIVGPDGKQFTGENLANALMKSETKAKRRVTLSMCGLGMLDESEVGSIEGAQYGTWEQVSGPVAALPTGDADKSIALLEIQQCETLAALDALTPRLSVLAPKSSPWRQSVLDAYRARKTLLTSPEGA